MSTMVAEIYDALRAAGADEAKSRAAAQAVAGLNAENYATKTDLEKLAAKGEVGGIKEEIAEMKGEMAEMKKEIAEVKIGVANLRSEFFKWGAAAVLTIIASQTATAFLIVSLLK